MNQEQKDKLLQHYRLAIADLRVKQRKELEKLKDMLEIVVNFEVTE